MYIGYSIQTPQGRRKHKTKQRESLYKGRIFGRNPDIRVFLLAIDRHLYSTALPLNFYFFNLTQPLTESTVQLLYTVKEKERNLIENIRPYQWFKNPYSNLKSENYQDYAQKPQPIVRS